MRSQYIVYVYILFSLLILIFQYSIKYFGYTFFSGVFVNDAQSYWGHLNDVYINGIESGNYFTLIGVIYLYLPAVIFGPIYCYLINSLLISFSFHFFLKCIKSINPLFDAHVFLIFILFISNIYILELLFSPNKEIPLIFLTNCFIYYFVFVRNNFLSFALILIAFFFRDGYSLMLFFSALIILVFRTYILNKSWNFLFYSCFVMMFLSVKALSSYGLLGDYGYILDRNIELESDLKFAANFPYFIQFLINLFNNAIGYSIRNQLFDSSYRLFLYGLGLWHFSVIFLIFIVSWIRTYKNYLNENLTLITFIIFFNLLMLSSSSFPQPRYMMPFFFWLIFISVLKFRFANILLFFCVLFMISVVFIFSGYSFELADGIDFDLNF